MITKLLGWRGRLVWVLRQFFLIIEKISSNRLGVWNRGLSHGLKGSRKSSECNSQSSVSRACLSCILPFSYSSRRGKAWTDRWEAIRAWPKPTRVLAHVVKSCRKWEKPYSENGCHSLTGLSWAAVWIQVWFFPQQTSSQLTVMGPPGFDSISHQQRETAAFHTVTLALWSSGAI